MSKDKPASPGQLAQKAGTTLGGVTKVRLPDGKFIMVTKK